MMKTSTTPIRKKTSKLIISIPFNVKWVVSEERKIEIVTDNPEILDHIGIIEAQNELSISFIGSATTIATNSFLYKTNVVVGNHNTRNVAAGNISIEENYGQIANTVINEYQNGVTTVKQNSDEGDKQILIKKIEIKVYAPSFKKITLSGISNMVASNLKQEQISINLSGKTDLDLSGKITSLDANVSGQSSLNADELIAQIAHLSASGQSEIKACVKDNLKAKVSGQSEINVYGNPRIVQKELLGQGEINLSNEMKS